jgi:predicted esterase
VNNKNSILFLHGFTQNSLAFQKRIKVLTKAIKQKLPNFDFIFPDAPYLLEEVENQPEEEIKRGWLYLNEEDKMSRVSFIKDPEVLFLGLNITIEKIIGINKNNFYNIECIFGFSQGALVTIFLSILICKSDYRKYFPNLKCIVLVSGFVDPRPKNEELLFYIDKLRKANSSIDLDKDEKLDIPCLNVYGIADEYILPDKSDKLKYLFDNIEIYPHKGKHYTPTSKDDIEIFIKFLKKYLQ